MQMPTEFPPEFFQSDLSQTPGAGNHPDLRRAVDWFKSHMSPEEWVLRRNAGAVRLYSAAMGGLANDPKGKFFIEQDKFGWYLFLAEAFLDHPHNYEPMYGSRVVPVFAAIGREVERLKQVPHIQDRVRRLVGEEKSSPNGGIFELLVAAAYLRIGAAVAFVPEQKGKAKTHDMDVTIGGTTFAVECKRIETSQYGEKERERMRQLWREPNAGLKALGKSAFCNVTFLVPLEEVPDDYLREHALSWLASEEGSFVWNDEIGHGAIGDLYDEPLREALSEHDILAAGTRMISLLAGSYQRHENYLQAIEMKPGENPRYVSDFGLAIVCRWQCLAPKSIEMKARHVMAQLAAANDQLPSDRPGIVHIGFEAVEGDEVEALRHHRIIETAAKFDPLGKPLEGIYCHYFAPESPPDIAWLFDETRQWCAIKPTFDPPLGDAFLVLPPGTHAESGGHWQL